MTCVAFGIKFLPQIKSSCIIKPQTILCFLYFIILAFGAVTFLTVLPNIYARFYCTLKI